MRDLTTRQLWNAVSGVLADSKDERAEEATRAVDELRRRCDVVEALHRTTSEHLAGEDYDGPDGEDFWKHCYWCIHEDIESALAQRGVGLEELKDA